MNVAAHYVLSICGNDLLHNQSDGSLPCEKEACGSDLEHNERWASEMNRLKAAGAPTDPLDFIPDYDENSWLVDAFIDAARAGASWPEAAACLFDSEVTPELRRVCRHFFDLERRSPYTTSAPSAQAVLG
jgi:hypothetical protein